MSEMIKNSDVEDVLFSIRRLVMDTPEEAAVEEVKREDAPKSGALILTSALRVNDPATEPEQVDLEDMTSDFAHFRDAVGRADDDVMPLPSLEEVFASAPEEDTPRRLHLSEVVKDEPKEEVQEIEPLILDTASAPATAEDLADRKWAENPDEDRLSDFATPSDTFGDAAEPELHEEPTDEIGETGEDEAVEMVDASDASLDDEAEDEPVMGAADGLADFDENILDEDALRDLVTEIVREELSGELGERITRNVRKLVRREIHRAMMTRDFD